MIFFNIHDLLYGVIFQITVYIKNIIPSPVGTLLIFERKMCMIASPKESQVLTSIISYKTRATIPRKGLGFKIVITSVTVLQQPAS